MQDFTQVGNTLTIPCMVGTEKIEIHGSWAIPEFGVIAAMILAVAIVSIIVITAKTRLSWYQGTKIHLFISIMKSVKEI